MKQLINYINEALIKKDTKLKSLSNFLIFIPWNDDYENFEDDGKIDDFYMITFYSSTTNYIWIISFTDIEKIKLYTKNPATKIYYPPVEYSREQFIQACNDHKITLKNIREYKEYQI